MEVEAHLSSEVEVIISPPGRALAFRTLVILRYDSSDPQTIGLWFHQIEHQPMWALSRELLVGLVRMHQVPEPIENCDIIYQLDTEHISVVLHASSTIAHTVYFEPEVLRMFLTACDDVRAFDFTFDDLTPEMITEYPVAEEDSSE